MIRNAMKQNNSGEQKKKRKENNKWQKRGKKTHRQELLSARMYCGWNSLESAATYEVKIKIYVLL